MAEIIKKTKNIFLNVFSGDSSYYIILDTTHTYRIDISTVFHIDPSTVQTLLATILYCIMLFYSFSSDVYNIIYVYNIIRI